MDRLCTALVVSSTGQGVAIHTREIIADSTAQMRVQGCHTVSLVLFSYMFHNIYTRKLFCLSFEI